MSHQSVRTFFLIAAPQKENLDSLLPIALRGSLDSVLTDFGTRDYTDSIFDMPSTEVIPHNTFDTILVLDNGSQ